MKIIMLGPPGSGKGTYSSRISSILKIPQISTGDLIRAEIKSQTDIGKKIQGIVNSGKLAPDEIAVGLLKKRMLENDCKNGFILDGCPRTLEQAEDLNNITKIDVVLNLVLPEDILIRKITARRVCEKCGDNYNIADINEQGISMPPMLPKKTGVCDKCGGKLIQRKDDIVKVIKERLDIYRKQTAPLIDYYKKKNLLKDVKITSAPEIMVPKIMEVLNHV